MKEILFVIVACLVWFTLGVAYGLDIKEEQWHAWAISNGYAHYDHSTGELVLHKKD